MLALLSGVLSKVGVYGFLRIVLPVMPDGAQYWQELFIILAVFSILYGSILAFSQDNVRMVLAYSSIAQLGFIVLGIFAIEEKGAQGALFQMLNHGLVTVPLFLILGVIAIRARGSESLSELGGMAFRAPVLAGLFLVISLATLAMPGSGNFVGEILILFGAFEDQLVYGLVASVGVVLAAVYMIRLYQGTMHGRVGPAVESRDIDRVNLAAIVPLVAVIVALGVYPNFVVDRTEKDTGEEHRPREAPHQSRGVGDHGERAPRTGAAGPRDRLQGAVAAVRAGGRLGDRADGRPARLALRPRA